MSLGCPQLDPVKQFPASRTENRRILMDAVEEVGGVLEAGREEAEKTGTLPRASVEALEESGLLRLKLPRVLGGAEADLITQLDVLEAVSRIDSAAGWCLMIGAASVGSLAAFLPDDAIQEVFADGKPPRAAGVFSPFGTAVPVNGGYQVSGWWRFGSGILHSQWVAAGARVVAEEDGHPDQVRVVVPTSDLEIHDNWQVMGLRGTGSCDFSADNLFVPARFAWDVSSAEPKRGGGLYRMGRPGFVTNEHSAFALGVARRALDVVAEEAASKIRGYNSENPLTRRPVFQRALGECDLRLRAARALNVETLEEAWQAASRGEDAQRSSASPDAGLCYVYNGSGGRCGSPGVPVRRRVGFVRVEFAATVPAGHQRGGPTPDGQRHRLRKPRAIFAGAARRQGVGVTILRQPYLTGHKVFVGAVDSLTQEGSK